MIGYIHCRKCVEELDKSKLDRGLSPRDYARFEVSVETADDGSSYCIINCTRHDLEIAVLKLDREESAGRDMTCEMCKSGVEHSH